MPTERAYVDTPPGDLGAASAAAARAAAALGVAEPRLVRAGMNAIFVTDDVVLRVGHTNAPGRLAIELAQVLTDHGVRVPRPRATTAIEVVGFTVTAWERLVPTGGPIDWHPVGRMVATVHAVAPHALPVGLPVPSPVSFPWWDLESLLADLADELDPGSRDGLRAAVQRHARWVDDVASDPVVCHGDVHPGNVVQTTDGPVLLDWDLLCLAPWGWDHAPMVTWAARWGGSPGEYEAFAAGYGRSALTDPFALAVAELRLVAATLMRVRAGRTDPHARAEAERRLRYWRGDPDPPAWRAQ